MDKYKNFIKIEELKGLMRSGKKEEALEIAQGIDLRKVKENWDLMVIGEVFLNNGILGKAKECYTMVYNRKKSRRVAMELVNICIRLKKADEAEQYYEDYRRMAPNDYYNYIFKYRIDRLKGKSLKEQAQDLEALKRVEFTDTWGYELAKLYHKMGEGEKCLKVCEDVIVWFGDGEAVDKAKTLKALYLGEITLKEFNNPDALNSKAKQDVDIDVVIDYQMEFDHAVDEIMNQGKEEEKTEEIPVNTPPRSEMEEEFTEKELTEETENKEPIQAEPSDEQADEPSAEENSAEEVYTEEEYTEEDLLIGEKEDNEEKNAEVEESAVEEDEDMKILPPKIEKEEKAKESVKKEKTPSVRRTMHDTDFFTDEIAKAVEQALKEDSTERKAKEDYTDPQEATREWRKEEASATKTGKAALEKEKAEPGPEEDLGETRQIGDVREELEKEENTGSGSRLMDAVERELGFVGETEDSDKAVKKSWFDRIKEKHKEKELKKKGSERKASEEKEREQLEKLRAAELEKQRFIENEKRKDRQKYLAYKKQMAIAANEKAVAEEEAKAADSFLVDIKGLHEERETGETVNGVYTPKKLKCMDIPGNSSVAGYLAGTGRTLEDYFGFFACQRNMGSQILNCLERLLDPDEEFMNYCIIGERGTGKKAIAHGFARFMADCGRLASSQTVWTDSNKINSIDLSEKTEKLKGRCLVIDQAGSLDREGIEDIAKVIERLHKKTMLVLADYPRNMVELFKAKEGFEDMFAPRIIIPSFSQDDLFDYVDYKIGSAGFVLDSEAYDLMTKRIKSIMRATEEGALARTEKFIVKTIDNAEQKNGEAYIRQTLENEKHTRSNVITASCLPEGL